MHSRAGEDFSLDCSLFDGLGHSVDDRLPARVVAFPFRRIGEAFVSEHNLSLVFSHGIEIDGYHRAILPIRMGRFLPNPGVFQTSRRLNDEEFSTDKHRWLSAWRLKSDAIFSTRPQADVRNRC